MKKSASSKSNTCAIFSKVTSVGKFLPDSVMSVCAMLNGTLTGATYSGHLPNKEISCSSGSDSLSKYDCIVKNDAEHMTDIYPIRFHDGIVEPASAAGRYILKTTK